MGVTNPASCQLVAQVDISTGYHRMLDIRLGSLSDRQTGIQAGRQQEWECNIHQVIPPVTLYYLSSLNLLCHHPH